MWLLGKKSNKKDSSQHYGTDSWWISVKQKAKNKYPKIVIDESDPEYDAQKIYGTWLKMFKYEKY